MKIIQLYISISFFVFILGSIISYVPYDKNVKRELKEYSTRLTLLVDKLQADLSERNTYNNHRSVREKSKRIKIAKIFNKKCHTIYQLQL